MKASEYRKMNTADLETALEKLKRQLFNFRFQLAAGQQTNNQALVACKRDIARIKTVLRQRELAEQAALKKAE